MEERRTLSERRATFAIIVRMTPAKKKGILRRLFGAFVALVIIVAAVLAATNAAVVLTTRDRVITLEEAYVSVSADYVVVLGASVYEDGTPSGVLRDRLDDGIELYRAGIAPVIIMSGDGVDDSYNEVEAMYDYAIEQGVPSSAIICDNEGFSTYESVWRACNVYHADSVVIATQSYHLYRALYAAEGLGLEAWGVSSDYHAYDNQLSFDVREIPARTKDFFQTLFKVTPSSLPVALSSVV